MTRMSMTVTQTETQLATLVLIDPVEELFCYAKSKGVPDELLDQLHEKVAAGQEELALAHLFHALKGDEKVAAHLRTKRADADAFLEAYPRGWLQHMIKDLVTDPKMLAHLLSRTKSISLSEERIPFCLLLCYLIFSNAERASAPLALLEIALPSGQEASHFLQRYRRLQEEYEQNSEVVRVQEVAAPLVKKTHAAARRLKSIAEGLL